jgi:hypothetical protein
MGTAAEALPVGHAAVATYPDRSYLRWEYKYETGEPVERNNAQDFREACKYLYGFFSDFVRDNATHGPAVRPVNWGSIAAKVGKILRHEGPKEDRVALWQEAISKGQLFQATQQDKKIEYEENLWRSTAIVNHFESGGDVDECDACLFIRAAWKHRNYVIQKLMPEIGLTAY